MMDIEDYVSDSGLLDKVRQALVEARSDGEGRALQIAMRIREPGEKMRTLGHITVRPNDTEPSALRRKLKEQLLQDLGDEVEGRLRLEFYHPGMSGEPITSHQRTLKPFEAETSGTSDNTKSLERMVGRLLDVNIELTKANAMGMASSAEVVKNSGEVIKGMNPQPDNWVQLAGALLPVAGAMLGKKGNQGSQGNQGSKGELMKPVVGKIYQNDKGDQVHLDASGQWHRKQPDGTWAPCEVPPGFEGSKQLEAPTTSGEAVTEAEGAEATGEGTAATPAPSVQEQVEQLLGDEEGRAALLKTIKAQAAEMNITDPQVLAQLLAAELETV